MCVTGSWLLQGALKNKLVLLQTYQIPRNREPSIRMEFKKEKRLRFYRIQATYASPSYHHLTSIAYYNKV